MVTSSMIYWITRLDYISEFFKAMSAFTGIASAVMIIAIVFFADEIGAEMKSMKKYFAMLITGFLLFTAGLIFTPTTNEMAAIYIVPAVANSETTENILGAADDASKVLKEKTAEWLKETLKKNK